MLASSSDSSDSDTSDRMERYYERQANQQCTECGVAVGPDRQLCDRHLAAQNKAASASMARLRAGRRAAGECAEGCGRASKTYRCSVCRPTKAGVNGGVNVRQHARFHTEGVRRPVERQWVTEVDGKRRQRFRGKARRGQPTRLETDEWDLRAIETEISRARADLQRFYSEENQALPRVQREAAKRSALGHLELVQRFADELVERTRKGLR